MGRRSINTTKSGKYMNPTDQARKEARKQELKKNKKQRQMVRAAVLKGKDPQQILEEMEKIDQMEYNVNQPSPLNEKVLKDKRKKLRDTLERVLSMYHKDDPDKWTELKRRQAEYEHKRNQMIAFYESVKSAQQVQVDEIPLPQVPQQPPPTTTIPAVAVTTTTTSSTAGQIPLPVERKQEHTIYSIATALKLQALGQPVREPPGCPPGPPPNINDDGEVEDYIPRTVSEDEHKEELNKNESKSNESESPSKPSSVQQKMVALSGQNVDDFMKEMEVAQKKLETAATATNPSTNTSNIVATTIATAASVVIPTSIENQTQPKLNESLMPPGTDLIVQQSQTQLQPTTQNLNPNQPTLMFPAVPNLRLPPGPPPGRPLLPPGPPPGLPPPRMPPIRMSSAPPPPPPRMIRLPPPGLPNAPPNLPLGTPNVLSAAPQLINRIETSKQQGATITAKPQIRNLSADVTRFVPSALRIKREDKKPKVNTRALVQELKQKEYHFHQSTKQPTEQHTKDDAYKQFMEEMQNLL